MKILNLIFFKKSDNNNIKKHMYSIEKVKTYYINSISIPWLWRFNSVITRNELGSGFSCTSFHNFTLSLRLFNKESTSKGYFSRCMNLKQEGFSYQLREEKNKDGIDYTFMVLWIDETRTARRSFYSLGSVIEQRFVGEIFLVK